MSRLPLPLSLLSRSYSIFRANSVHRKNFDTIVQVKVGPEKNTFNIHKSILCNAGPYFKAALEGNFSEARDQILELPEDEPAVFERFQLWLYTNRVLEEEENVGDVSYDELVELYIFADLRGTTSLQNALVEHIIDKESLDEVFPSDCIPRIYQCLSPNHPLRRLLVDMAAAFGNLDEWFKCNFNEFVPEFLMELVVAQYHMRTSKEGKGPRDVRLAPAKYYVMTD